MLMNLLIKLKIVKKKEVFSDGGVHHRTNFVDVVVVTGCVVVIVLLVFLTVMAYKATI